MLKKLLLLVLLFGILPSLHSQSTKGKDFWFGYINNLVTVAPDVYISSDMNVSGTISIPGLGYSQAITVTGGTTARFTLPVTAVTPFTEGTHNLAVHVETCEYVTVYAVNPGSASSDASVVFPTPSLGIEYTVLNMTGNPQDWGDAALIVATADNTEIEIIPSINTSGGRPAGVPFTITLNQGESYQVKNSSGAVDLTGTVIRGVNTANCLPFAVFSGAPCINIGGCGACDHIYEQLLPNNTLGMSYAAIPLAQKNRTHYRIMAIENNTDVSLNGTVITTLNAGQYYQYADNNYTLINSSKPVAVMQYAEGVNCGGPGDPFQVLLYPIEQSLESITFNAFQTPLVNKFWINILVQSINVPNVTLDGANISASFTPFASNPAYSYARVSITQGDHTLISPGGSLATVYGWGNAESFGYCAGASLKDLTNDFSIVHTPTCTDDVINFAAIPDPSTAGFSWDFGDGSPAQTGINSSHSYATPGTYEVTLTKQKTNSCDVLVIKPLDIFELPINITQADTSICTGSTLNLEIPLSDEFVVERLNDCGDISYNMIYIEYDTIYWSTGQSGRTIQITPTTDTMIYVYGEQFGSSCRAIDSVFIQVIDLTADFTFNDACQTDEVCLINQSITNAPYDNTRYSMDNVLLVADDLEYCFVNPVPGTYDIELYIETDIGCKDSITKTVEIFPQPTAEFDFTNACDNEEILFESASIPNIGTITDYVWDINNDGITDNTTDAFGHTYGQDGFYTVEHSVNNSYGCSDTISKQITVYALPTTDFTVDAVCEDATTTFVNGSSIIPVDNDVISTYEWTFGDGNSSITENPTHNYGTENVYNAQLVITTNYGCKDSLTLPVNVYPLPIVDFSVTSECMNNESVFTDLSTVSSTNTANSLAQWDWDFGDGGTDSQQNPNYQYASSGTYNSTLTVETNNGCIASVVKPTVVFELPTSDFDFTNACDNEEIVLESTAVPNEGTISDYLWDVNDNGTIDYTVNPVNHVYTQDGFHTVKHIVITSNGCSDTLTKEVTVYALPTAEFTVDAVCEDATTTFANGSGIVPVDNDVISNYNWTFGNGNSSSTENPTQSYGTENVYTAQLVITTNYGCKDSISHPVNVYPLPVPDFTPTSVCLEDASEFTDLTTISNDHTTNNIVQWNWDFGDGTTSTVPNPNNGYATDGTFTATLEVVSNHGCVEEITKTVTVHPLPVAQFTGSNLEGCSPVCPEITSISTINSPSTVTTYDWTLSDGTTYQGPSFSDCYYNESGNSVFYDLTLLATSNEGCVNSHTENNYIEIYHNPTADFYYEPEEPSVIDNEVEFFNTSMYSNHYAWTFGNEGLSTETNPIFTFKPEPGIHEITLIASTMQGCTDTAKTVIVILDKIIFYVPNTFTPDGDKFNETFQPVFTSGFDPQDFTMYIFNRWGELIFESHNSTAGWPGTYGEDSTKPVKEGVYVWKIEFKETMSDKRHTHSGHVNLLR